MFTLPLWKDTFVKNIGKFYECDFLTMLLKFYWLTFKKEFKSLATLRSSHAIFEVFRAHLKEFSIFFHEMVEMWTTLAIGRCRYISCGYKKMCNP